MAWPVDRATVGSLLATLLLVAALLGWVVLREPLTISRALGVFCVVVGVILLRK